MMHFSLSRPYPSSGDDSPLAAEPGKCSTTSESWAGSGGRGLLPAARAARPPLLVSFSLSTGF